jgi:hypothetical protein
LHAWDGYISLFSVPPVENKAGAFGVFRARWGHAPRKPSHFTVATRVYSSQITYFTISTSGTVPFYKKDIWVPGFQRQEIQVFCTLGSRLGD